MREDRALSQWTGRRLSEQYLQTQLFIRPAQREDTIGNFLKKSKLVNA